MRRIEGSGEKELRGATAVIWLRISSRAGGWKTRRSWRSVIRRVLEGGVGWESAGMLAISRDRDGRDVWDEPVSVRDESREHGGETEVAILYMCCMYWGLNVGGGWIRGEDKGGCHRIRTVLREKLF